MFQCVIVVDGARSGDWGHDWPHVLKRPRPHDREEKTPGSCCCLILKLSQSTTVETAVEQISVVQMTVVLTTDNTTVVQMTVVRTLVTQSSVAKSVLGIL